MILINKAREFNKIGNFTPNTNSKTGPDFLGPFLFAPPTHTTTPTTPPHTHTPHTPSTHTTFSLSSSPTYLHTPTHPPTLSLTHLHLPPTHLNSLPLTCTPIHSPTFRHHHRYLQNLRCVGKSDAVYEVFR